MENKILKASEMEKKLGFKNGRLEEIVKYGKEIMENTKDNIEIAKAIHSSKKMNQIEKIWTALSIGTFIGRKRVENELIENVEKIFDNVKKVLK